MHEKRENQSSKFPLIPWVLLSSMVNCVIVMAFVMEWGIVAVMILGWIAAEMQFRLSKGKLPRFWVYMSVLGYGLAALVMRKADLQDWSLQDGPVNYEYVLKAALVLGITQALAFYRCIPQGIAWAVLTTLAWRYGAFLPVYIATNFTYEFTAMGGFGGIWTLFVLMLIIGPAIIILLGVIPSLFTGGILSWISCKPKPEPQVEVTETQIKKSEKIVLDVRKRIEQFFQDVVALLPDRKIEKRIWILYNTLGVGIAAGTSMVAAMKIESMGALSWSIVLFGVGIGVLQWIVLRRVVDFDWWVVTTALGGAPALVIVMNTRRILSEAVPQIELDFPVLAIDKELVRRTDATTPSYSDEDQEAVEKRLKDLGYL